MFNMVKIKVTNQKSKVLVALILILLLSTTFVIYKLFLNPTPSQAKTSENTNLIPAESTPTIDPSISSEPTTSVQPTQNANPTNQPKNDPYSGWQTIKDDRYFITLKYPANWTKNESTYFGDGQVKLPCESHAKFLKKPETCKPFPNPQIILNKPNYKNFSMIFTLNDPLDPSCLDTCKAEFITLTIADKTYKAKKLSYPETTVDGLTFPVRIEVILLENIKLGPKSSFSEVSVNFSVDTDEQYYQAIRILESIEYFE
jgi:hypothetical protein